MSVVVSHFSVYHVDGVRAYGVVMIFETEVVCFVVRVIRSFMKQIPILRKIFLTTLLKRLRSINIIALIVEIL